MDEQQAQAGWQPDIAFPRLKPLLAKAVRTFGTPAYVYFFDTIVERLERLKAAFDGRFSVSYAVKANPNRALIQRMAPHVGGFDVSSAGELVAAIECGVDSSRLSFSGPGKTRADLEVAVDRACGEVIVESIDEMVDLNAIASARRKTVSVIVRVNPRKIPRGFGVRMASRPSQFGIDEEVLAPALVQLKTLSSLRLSGFHIYAGTQCLEAASIAENFSNYVDIFAQFTDADARLEKLIFGAGFGIPYTAESKSLDLADVAQRVAPLFEKLKADPRLNAAVLSLELGRFVIGPAGYYLTKVIRRKSSRGREICVCDGGLNHHLAACGHFGSSILRTNYPMFNLSAERGNPKPYDAYGPLCTSIDGLAHDVLFAPLEVGDVIAVASSGAYGLTASPLHFIGHPPPKEILVSGDDLEDITEYGAARRGA